MQDMGVAFNVFIMGLSSVFLIMIILMLVLQLFGIVVRRWEREKKAE